MNKWEELKKHLKKEKRDRKKHSDEMFQQTKHKDMRMDEMRNTLNTVSYMHAMEHCIDNILFRIGYIEEMEKRETDNIK